MDNISILKELDQNRDTKDTSSDDHKWVSKMDMPKIKAQFKGIQIKILNIFTLAKSELSSHYQKIVSRIKRIQKYLYNDAAKVMPTFWNMLQQIELQIEQKISQMSANLQASIVTSFLFDQLISFMPDACNQNAQTFNNSQRKINNSSLSSGNRLTQKNMSHTVCDLNSINLNEYRSAIKVKPNQKRIENLGCLSGKWDVLEQLNLENKKISMMIPFSTIIAQTLQEINLSHNEIHRLDFLRQAEYPILRVLNLNKNLITNLDGIQSTTFPNLKILNLSENKLKKLSHLQQCNFQYLIQLNLSHNRIAQPQPLISCNFPKLQILNLDHNLLPSIEFILSCTFYRLKILSFCYNELKSIECLKKCKLQKLEALLAYNNRIDSIGFLEFCDFPQLKEIILNNNAIEDIGVVDKMKFKNLVEFDLENNNIRPKEVMCFVVKNDQCKMAKKKYPFIQL